MTECIVTADYRSPDNQAATGRVVFELVSTAYDDTINAIYPPAPVSAVLDAGQISVGLQPTSGVDSDWNVSDLTYQVTERIRGCPPRIYYVDIPSEATVDLGSIATYDQPRSMVWRTPTLDLDTTGYLTEAAAETLYVPADPVLVITYNGDGTVASVTTDGIATTYTYNGDGTVATQTRLGVTRTYTYTADNLTGVA